MHYDVRLDNTGNKPCGSKSLQLQHSEFFVGPCGSLSSTVVNALGVDVFPGAAVVLLPGVQRGPPPRAHHPLDPGLVDG